MHSQCCLLRSFSGPFSNRQRNYLLQNITCVVFDESDQFGECLFDGTGRLDGKKSPFFIPGSTMAGADAGEACYQRNIAEQCASAGAPQILV